MTLRMKNPLRKSTSGLCLFVSFSSRRLSFVLPILKLVTKRSFNLIFWLVCLALCNEISFRYCHYQHVKYHEQP